MNLWNIPKAIIGALIVGVSGGLVIIAVLSPVLIAGFYAVGDISFEAAVIILLVIAVYLSAL